MFCTDPLRPLVDNIQTHIYKHTLPETAHFTTHTVNVHTLHSITVLSRRVLMISSNQSVMKDLWVKHKLKWMCTKMCVVLLNSCRKKTKQNKKASEEPLGLNTSHRHSAVESQYYEGKHVKFNRWQQQRNNSWDCKYSQRSFCMQNFIQHSSKQEVKVTFYNNVSV